MIRVDVIVLVAAAEQRGGHDLVLLEVDEKQHRVEAAHHHRVVEHHARPSYDVKYRQTSIDHAVTVTITVGKIFTVL